MDVLARQYGLKSVIHTTDDLNALKMAEMDLVDILVLDDPVHAFMYDLDFIPIARDDLVLVSGSDEYPDSVEKLEGEIFVEVPHSAQRLAWNTLDQLRVDYEIVHLCSSPHNALEMVKSSDDLYTFLNSSFISESCHVSDLLEEDTRHIISMILCGKNRELEEFKEFILGRGQDIISDWGFKRIN